MWEFLAQAGGRFGARVQDRVLLDVRAVADNDLAPVTAQNRSRPDEAPFSDRDPADDNSFVVHVCGLAHLRLPSLEDI